MGCVTDRFGPTEQTMIAHSVRTGFEKLPVEVAVGAIRELSTCKVVLPGQFLAIRQRLRLNNSPSDITVLNNFYEKLAKASTEELLCAERAYPRLASVLEGKVTAYRVDELVVVAVLLSEGSVAEKAAALFDLLDEGCAGSVPERSVEDLFRLLLRVAVEDLPSLLRGDTADVVKYLARCRDNQQRAVEALKQLVLKTASSVSRNGFQAQVVAYRGLPLTSPCGLRNYASSLDPRM